MIKITLPNGNIKEIHKGQIALDVARIISPSLSKKTIGSIQNGEVVDLITPINNNIKLELLTDEKGKNELSILRHSTSHVLAKSIINLYPKAHIAIGPSISEGFYYDIDFNGEIFSENDLDKLEIEMNKIIKSGFKFERKIVNKKHLLSIFKNNPYKKEMIENLYDNKEEITSYTMGDFEDLCKGPHLLGVGKIKHFKLTHISGAYWRGDSKSKQLTRIYGTAFFNKEDLDNHLEILEERKNRDHRKIGKELDIFMFDQLGGRGFTFWLPNGLKVKNRIKKLIKAMQSKEGYLEIETPIVGDSQLYKTSGHLDHYKDTMFPKMEIDGEEMYLRPMSCPHHCLYYKFIPRSYKDLPFRISENVNQYRFEKSGALRGIERTRAMELTDSHIFIMPNQIDKEVTNIIKFVQEVLNRFNIEIDYIELALRDKNNKEKYHSNNEMWDKSEEVLKDILESIGIKYKAIKGEAAFYGPKIDIQVKTALGHSITMSTIQLDFLLPQKFELDYINKKGEKKTPVLIHRGLIGTYERFISILLEQTKGHLPFWLSPRQIAIIPVNNDSHESYSKDLKNELFNNGIFNIDLDSRDERLSYKIRNHQKSKTNYQVVIGDKEVKNDEVTYRLYGEEKETTIKRTKFVAMIKKQNQLPL